MTRNIANSIVWLAMVALTAYGCYHAFDFSLAVSQTLRMGKGVATDCRVTEFTHRVKHSRKGPSTIISINFEYDFRGTVYRQSSKRLGIWELRSPQLSVPQKLTTAEAQLIVPWTPETLLRQCLKLIRHYLR